MSGLASSSSGEQTRIVIKAQDMSTEMKDDVLRVAKEALEQNSVERDIAKHIKLKFDKRYGPTWHCIVGKNFGSFVTHESQHFIYFNINNFAILLFKAG